MNDDVAAELVQQTAEASSSRSQNPNNENDADTGSSANAKEDRLRARHTQRLAFLDHLVRNLDILFYAQLSALYYSE